MPDSSSPRLGAIYPDDAWVDVETQAYVDEFRAFLPSTVEMISAATPVLPGDATVESAVEMAESGHIEEAARRLLRHKATCFAYYCTTVSFIRGPGADLEISHRITEATRIEAATTTSTAMILALRALGVSRVALASPYLSEVEQKLIEFVEAHGIRVSNSVSLSLSSGHFQVSPDEVRQLAESTDTPDAEAVFVACTGLRLSPHLEAMENSLGKPVLTANQVTSWHALRLMGVAADLPKRGKLFLAGAEGRTS